jgi:hypothetical protein
MKTKFSLFDGKAASEFNIPMDYWKDFMDDELAAFDFEVEPYVWHFHCCVNLKNEDLSENDFLSDFFKKLPFLTIDKEGNITHFWWQTPELKPLLLSGTNTYNPDNLATTFLDSMLQLLSSKQTKGNTFVNLSDLETFINNAKKVITEAGILEIRERYKLKHENAFKSKYWL